MFDKVEKEMLSALNGETNVIREILDILNGKIAIRESGLLYVPENLYVWKCEVDGYVDGVLHSSDIAWSSQTENTQDSLREFIRKIYRKPFPEINVAAVMEALESGQVIKAIKENRKSSELDETVEELLRPFPNAAVRVSARGAFAMLELRQRDFRVTFKPQTAREALADHIVSHYGPFIFRHLVTDEISPNEFHALLPLDKIMPTIMETCVSRVYTETMKKYAEENIRMAEDFIRLPLLDEGGERRYNCPFVLSVIELGKEKTEYDASDFRTSWQMRVMQKLPPDVQLRFFRCIEENPENMENAETHKFLSHLLDYAGFGEKEKSASFKEQIRFFSRFLEKKDDISGLPAWNRGVCFYYVPSKNEVSMSLLCGSYRKSEYPYPRWTNDIGEKVDIKDFIDPQFMLEFFNKNEIYPKTSETTEAPSCSPGM